MTDISAVLARLEPCLGAITEDPVPLGGGITNRNYLVHFDQRACVLRLPGKDTSLLGISRQGERLANAAAAALGIAPAVLAAGEDFLLTEYVAGIPADARSLATAPEPAALALRAFHDSGTELPTRFWVPDLLGSYERIILARGARPPDWLTRAQTIVDDIGVRLALTDPVPCHNDLLPANLLWRDDGTIMLVDWEYAGMGHRMFDLANLAAGAELDGGGEARLLAAYFGEAPGEERRQALALMRIVSDAREAAWGALQAVVSDLDFDFDAYAARHFERLAGVMDA